MASTTFVDNQTIIYASWLNDVNNLTYNGVLPNGILNSSTLALQTGGINALTIDASQNVTINNLVLSGSVTAPAGFSVTGNVTVSGTLSGGVVTGAKFSPTYGIYESVQTISTNYTITTSSNAMSIGPTTLAPGVSVTVPPGSRYVVL
jgi:hypothetical protein